MKTSDAKKIVSLFWENFEDWRYKFQYKHTNIIRNWWFNISATEELSFVNELIRKDLDDDVEPLPWITLLMYNRGDFFGLHTDDKYRGSSEDDILYSGGYLLNDDYEGGEFILDGETLDKEIGELFTFKRDVPHEVLPVTKGVRLSLHFSVREKKDGNNI